MRSPYSRSSRGSVSRANRPQNGHSKSTNSTTVTYAPAGPRAGRPSVVTFTGAAGDAAADCPAGGAP